MTSLTHEQAREFVQQDHLAEEDRLALRQHLMDCDDCRAFAATHIYLMRNLPSRAPSARPTTAQRAAVLDAAAGRRAVPRLWRPLSAVGSVAAVMFLALAFWLVLRAASPFASQPVLPAPLATLLAPITSRPTPTPAPTPDPRGRYVFDTVPAPSLAGNLIGEPLEQKVAIYLPPSYDDGSARRYPVVYSLTDDYQLFSNHVEQHKKDTRLGMSLALDGGAREMIVVTPNIMNALNLYNFWVNSPVSGNRENFIAIDLVNYIDAHYRTLPAADSRGLFGESSDGLSALTIAMRHPDTFGAVYLQRPVVISQASLDVNAMVSPNRVAVLDLIDALTALPSDEVLAGIKEWFTPGKPYLKSQIEAASYGMAFAPATEPPYFEYPYTDPDSPPDLEIQRRWESGLGDIPAKIEAHRGALQTLDIAVSSSDEPGTGSTYLSEQLTAAGIPHAFSRPETTLLEELGNEVFPFFSEVLAFD